MKKKTIDYLMNIIERNFPKYKKTKLDKVKYGLEGLYLGITKIVIIIIISVLLGQFNHFLIFSFCFSILRFNGFGLHLKTSNQCLIYSVIIFIGFPYLASLVFLLYAPADTEKRPLINRRKRFIHKLSLLFVACIYIFLSLFFHNNFIVSSLVLSLILEILLILPITYRIFKLPYRNYKKKGGANV